MYYHENRPLPDRYVIVDEAFMIDLYRMYQLISAVADSSVLGLLGDADQLPAVESGTIFRDPVPDRVVYDGRWHNMKTNIQRENFSSGSDPLSRQVVRVTENFRVRGGTDATANLIGVAQSINDGGSEITFFREQNHPKSESVITIRSSFDDLQFRGVEMFVPRGISDGNKMNAGRGKYFNQWNIVGMA